MSSNYLEGWGSVIYEALSEGCAVVASHACGCTNWLVKPGKTGLVFRSGRVESLEDKLYRFLTDETLRKTCQRGAYEQMRTLWNPGVAAERLVEQTRAVMSGAGLREYEDGPLSRAGILHNDWYRD
jgi:glycosyltransferase involved in cell wall biosynthesis